MSNFKKTPFGAVFNKDEENTVEDTVVSLKTLLRSLLNDTSIARDPSVYIELVKLCVILRGPSFREFLITNFDKGLGQQSQLVKEIVRFLAGDTSARGIKTQITINQSLILSRIPKGSKYTYSAVSSFNGSKLEEVQFVTNSDFSLLVTALGPINLAKLFLTLTGEIVDVTRR